MVTIQKTTTFFENCNRLHCKLHASTFFEFHRSNATLTIFQVLSCLFLCKAKLNLFTQTDAKTRFTHCYRLVFGKAYRNIGCLLSDIAFDAPATVIFASLEGNSATRGSSCTPNVVAKFCAKSTLCNKRTPCSGMRFC